MLWHFNRDEIYKLYCVPKARFGWEREMSAGSLVKYLVSGAYAVVLICGTALAQSGSESAGDQPGATLDSIEVGDRANPGADSDLGVDFSFRGERTQQEEPEFLYLDFEDAAESSGAPALPDTSGFTPRPTAGGDTRLALDARGLSRTARTFTPRYAGAALSLGSGGDSPDMPAIDIALSSQFATVGPEMVPMSGASGLLNPLDRQSMNIGLSVGYSGFHIGASLTRESGGFESGYEGINLGLGYAWADFSTEISVGDYSALDSGISLAGLTDYGNFQKLELGAAYAVSERLRFSGGVRLFDYGRRLGLTGQPERSGVLYLGTRLNF